MAREQPANDGDAALDGHGRTPDDATATEETPLLSSDSSVTLRSGASSPPRRSRPRAASETSSHVPNHHVGLPRAVAVGMSMFLLVFLQSTNMSGMTMIQGQVAEDLGAYEEAMWFTTAFFIPASSLAPVAGRLADIFSPRSLIIPVAVLIAAGSLIASLAKTFAVFILGRSLTGAGCGGVLTLSVILVLDLTTKRKRGLFIGLLNAGYTIGISSGAVVFGALLPVIGWRPLFWIQAPVAIVGGIGIYLSIPSSMSSTSPTKPGSVTHKLARIDYLGALLLMLTITLFLFGLAGDIQPWPLLASLGTLIAFVAVEYLLASDPIVPLKVLSSRGVLLSCLGQLGFSTARWSVLFYAPILMLAVRGAAPAIAGAVLIPTNLGFGLAGITVGALHVRRAGAFWLPTQVALACFAAMLYGLAVVAGPDAPLAAFIGFLFANGLATGAGFNYTLAHLLHLSHHDTHYVTTSLLGTFRGFGGSFGGAIGGGIFQRVLRRALTDGYLALDGGAALNPERQQLVSKLLGTPQLVFHGGLESSERHVAVEGYATAMRSVWQAGAVLAVLMIVVQAGTGWTAPREREEDEDDRLQARANVTENEGIGEA